MFKQPHKHHEGPITIALCESLIQDFAQMTRDIPLDPPVPGYDDDWIRVRSNWLGQLEYAQLRLLEVADTIAMGLPLSPSYHGQVIDICLSIKDDFAFGKANNFLDPSKEEK